MGGGRVFSRSATPLRLHQYASRRLSATAEFLVLHSGGRMYVNCLYDGFAHESQSHVVHANAQGWNWSGPVFRSADPDCETEQSEQVTGEFAFDI